jgi:iron(III) transport system permease protein
LSQPGFNPPIAVARRDAGAPLWLLLAAAAPVLLVALPLAYVAARGVLAGPAVAVAEIFRRRTGELLVNTLLLAVSVTVLSALIGVATAWCVERAALPGRRGWRVVCVLPLAVPAFVASFAWASLGPAFQTMGGAILILTLSHYPLVHLPVAAALRGMDPAFEDVARSLGRGGWRAFFEATLPQAAPALGAGALLVLTHMFAEFGALALLRVQTFTTAIFDSYQLEFDGETAALQSAVLLALALPAALFEMRLRRGLRFARSGKGAARRRPPIPLGRATWPALAGFSLLTALALGAPLTMLAYWLAVGSSAGRAIADLWPALGGSLGLALPGALVVTALGAPLALLATRHRGPFASFADKLPYVVHGLPGLVVALALVFFAIRFAPEAYQTAGLLFAAYAALFLPLAQSALRGSLELVPPRFEEVGRSLGRSGLGAFAWIVAPNILPGVGGALALLTLEIVRELTATLMLAPIGVRTLATEVWSHANEGRYAAAAPFAALLVVISAVPVYVFTRRAGELQDVP